MNRRQWMMLSGAAVAARGRSVPAPQAPSPADTEQDTPDKFLLKDYRPQSIYRVPSSEVKKAKFPAIARALLLWGKSCFGLCSSAMPNFEGVSCASSSFRG